MSDTFLVTGGAGFIGSALVRHLLDTTDRRVVNVDALTYAGYENSTADLRTSNRYVFVKADVADEAAMRAILAEHRPASVMHLAAETHVDRSIDAAEAFVHSNAVGTFRLLEASRAYWQQLSAAEQSRFRFVHVSTDEVYGSLGETGMFDEHSRYAPSSPYAASKAASDHFVSAWHTTYGFPGIITHASNNYGPRQYPEKLIPVLIARALAGEPLPIYGSGRNVRDWLYVEDHVRALAAIESSGRIAKTYNIAGGDERSTLDVAHAVCAALDEFRPGAHTPHSQLITFVADRPGHDFRYAMDTRHLSDELGWHPTVHFDDGIRRTVQWYLANPQWTA